MPQQPSPPFVSGALTDPRELQRWLDVNPQGGGLRRIQEYLTLPAFSQAVTWRGYSEIVAAFNYEGPNNFSLTPFSVPVNPNYALAIMWRDINNVTHRYWLWMGVGEKIYFPQVLYTQQVIKKNFRFEVWSTNSSPAVQVLPLTFYTSVLGNYDYQWMLDTSLVNNDPEVINFQNINGPTVFPVIAGISYRWTVLSGLTGSLASWTDSITGAIMTPSGVCQLVNGNTEGLVYANPIVKNVGSSGVLTCNLSAANIKLNTISVTFKSGTSSPDVVFFDEDGDNNIVVNGPGGTITLENSGGNICQISGLVEGTWYTVVVSVGNMWLFTTSTGLLFGSASGVAVLANATTIGIGTNYTGYFTEVILGTQIVNLAQASAIAAYMQAQYFAGTSFTLPLTFPNNAVPGTN